MPSLADIPTDLLPIHQRDPFTRWVQESKVDRSTGKHLLFLWSRNNGYTWTHAEIIAVIGLE